MTIQIKTVTGEEVLPWLDALALLRIEVFRDFPYLYDGDLAYERRYLSRYASSSLSLFVLALDSGRPPEASVVGASTAIALSDAEAAFQAPFIARSIPVENVLYFGESVLRYHYRGRGLGHRFFDEREAFAREQGKTITSFCAVERPDDHPLRPAKYTPLDNFWQQRGYHKQADMHTLYNWRDTNEPAPSDKLMAFWLREAPSL